jgi:hypothetical protein
MQAPAKVAATAIDPPGHRDDIFLQVEISARDPFPHASRSGNAVGPQRQRLAGLALVVLALIAAHRPSPWRPRGAALPATFPDS